MDYEKNKWYRDGNLLYTVRPALKGHGWENDKTIRVEGSDAEKEIEKLLEFLTIRN